MKSRHLIPSALIFVAYLVGVVFFNDADASKVKGIAGETPTSLLQNSSRTIPRFFHKFNSEEVNNRKSRNGALATLQQSLSKRMD